jgi:hypothetical protein
MWQMPPGSPPATFSRRLLRKQHTDADRLTFREFSARGSSKWRRGIFVAETKALLLRNAAGSTRKKALLQAVRRQRCESGTICWYRNWA